MLCKILVEQAFQLNHPVLLGLAKNISVETQIPKEKKYKFESKNQIP